MNQETLDSNLELLLDLEADGAATAAELETLTIHGADTGVDVRRRQLAGLHRVLVAGRVEARRGFREQVLAALEPAGWEARHTRAWRAPVAAMVVFGSLAAALLGRSAADGGAAFGLFGALRDFLLAVAVAGGGLATASWRGFNFALTDLIGSSLGTQISFVVVALGVNVGLLAWIRSVRRRARERAGAHAGR